jgi:riboflavin kinase / FMN adenylyltransferase
VKVLRDPARAELGLEKPAVSLGTFDGLHRGHAAILARLLQVARAEGRGAVAVTYDPHPQRVLAASHRAPGLLSTLDERLSRFESHGVDAVVVLTFTRAFSRLTAEQFVEDVLLGRLDAGHVVVGYDHAFGHDRRGKTDLMKEILAGHGIPFDVVSPVKIGEGPVKSSRIRRLLAAGDLDQAAALLGYPYEFSGRAVPGDQRGRELGFPTANLEVPVEKQLPPNGIYGAVARVDGVSYPALVHIGPRPTVGDGKLSIEAHLLDFPQRELYGTVITVVPEVILRKPEAFGTLADLTRQMEKDREQYIEYRRRKENTRAPQ